MRRSGFTLIELLVVVTSIGVLSALVLAALPGTLERARQASSLNNERQIGSGFHLFANDHEMGLPNRTESGDRWPSHLLPYLQDMKVYADPADRENFLRAKSDPLLSYPNNTSYIMNGFNDVGGFQNEDVTVRVNVVDMPSETILLGPAFTHRHFYMDADEGNQNDMLEKEAYNRGSNYLFVDGSVRFIKSEDYEDDLWLVHKDER